MPRFKKLLLGVSDDDAAVRYVARLAAATGAELTIVDVMEDIPTVARRLLPRSWNIAVVVRTHKQARLERSAALAERLGARPIVSLLSGPPIKALVREVARGRHDLLAVGASASGTVQFVGASARRLLREVPCPVLLVHQSRRRRVSRVLVAVGTDPDVSKGKGALTTKLIETAAWLAERRNGELHVLHAWVPYAERMLIRAGLTSAEVEEVLDGMREESRQDLEQALSTFRRHIDGNRVHLVKGDPRVVISEFATTHAIDLLVIGTVGRSGISGHLIGNTAEAVLSRIPCTMLVVKPDGWTGRRRHSRHTSPGRSEKRGSSSS